MATIAPCRALEAADTDAELTAAAVAGDGRAFDELYRRHVDAALRVALATVRNPDDARDAVAEAFTKVFRALPAARSFRPYLLTAVRNCALDICRRAERRELAEATEAREDQPAPRQPVDRIVADEDGRIVVQAFSRLPERWQQALWLIDVEERSTRDAGRALGVSANNAAQLASRARLRLREHYLQAHVPNHTRPRCGVTVAALGGFVAGTASARTRGQVDAHLVSCRDCRARVEELRDVASALRRAVLPLPVALAGVRARSRGRLLDWLERLRGSVASSSGGRSLTTLLPELTAASPALERLVAGTTAAVLAVGLSALAVGGHDRGTGASAPQHAASPPASTERRVEAAGVGQSGTASGPAVTPPPVGAVSGNGAVGSLGRNLSGGTLAGSDLSGADLTGAPRAGLDLTGVNLSGATLAGANLTGANLTGPDLTGVNLSGATLAGANLTGANLTGANLTGADLTGVNLSGATLAGANLTGAVLDGANLTGADLTGAVLTSAGLSGADLTGAVLQGARLTGADLRSARLVDADLRDVGLSGVDLGRADVTGALFGTLPAVPANAPNAANAATGAIAGPASLAAVLGVPAGGSGPSPLTLPGLASLVPSPPTPLPSLSEGLVGSPGSSLPPPVLPSFVPGPPALQPHADRPVGSLIPRLVSPIAAGPEPASPVGPPLSGAADPLHALVPASPVPALPVPAPTVLPAVPVPPPPTVVAAPTATSPSAPPAQTAVPPPVLPLAPLLATTGLSALGPTLGLH